jgi:hypothetical protein
MERSIPLILQWDENFDVGADTGTPVSEDYQVPFRFTGKLDKLTLTINRPTLTPADIEKLKQATRNNRASEERRRGWVASTSTALRKDANAVTAAARRAKLATAQARGRNPVVRHAGATSDSLGSLAAAGPRP